MTSALIEAAALSALAGKVKIIDATYADHGRQGWEQARIGNAVFFDIDEIADPQSDMPHMLPSPEQFAEAVSRLGISNDDDIVIYDQSGMASAACRAWWMFRVFGHDRVRVLDGGLPCWKAQSLPLNTAPPQPPPAGRFKSRFHPELVRNMSDVKKAIDKKDSLIIDARAAQRFAGIAPEQRPGLRSGHIPGSINTPYAALINPATGRMWDTELLKEIFGPIPADTHIIASCGSGVTACVLALGLYNLGRTDVAVYDGSWTEWGRESSATPVAMLA